MPGVCRETRWGCKIGVDEAIGESSVSLVGGRG